MTSSPGFDPRPEKFAPLRPDYGVHPGEVLRTILEQKNISQADLASRTRLSTKHVNQVLKGSASMSADVAIHLERVLGTPAHMWTSLESQWQEHRSRERDRAKFSTFIEWVRQLPIRELIRRDYLVQQDSEVDLVRDALSLFRVADPIAFERTWLKPITGGFRRSQEFSIDEFATASWLLDAERTTDSVTLPPFSLPTLKKALPELRSLTQLEVVEGFDRARNILNRCGIALVFIESFPGSRISGATWWPALNRPIVALSERQKKTDIFWFNLFHELAHLVHHSRRSACVTFEGGGDDIDGRETEADQFAAEYLIPTEYNRRIASADLNDLQQIATEIGVGLSIVAGRKGHLTGNWPSVARARQKLDVEGLRVV